MKIRNIGFAGDSGAQYFISKYREDIVRKVFNLYLELQSQSAVMKRLSEEKVPIPEVYKKTRQRHKDYFFKPAKLGLV